MELNQKTGRQQQTEQLIMQIQQGEGANLGGLPRPKPMPRICSAQTERSPKSALLEDHPSLLLSLNFLFLIFIHT